MNHEHDGRDAEMIIQTLCTEYKLHFTVVHGTSIGVYVVVYLRASPEPFRIYDRTFSDMNSLVEQFVRRINVSYFNDSSTSSFPCESMPTMANESCRQN